MAEQSSSVVAFRALVMVICLILIPVAAFCGGSFPAVVKAIQSGRWPTLEDFRGPAGPPSNQAIADAPRFVPGLATGSPQANDPKTLGFSSQLGGLGSTPQAETTRSPVIAASFTAPITAPPLNESGPSPSFPGSKDLSSGPTPRLSPLPPGMDNLRPLDRSATTGHSDAPTACPSGSAASLSNNQLWNVLDRLQKLGATYFVLEPCGDEKREFRFLCRMAIGGNPRVTKLFWCFDGDPMKAMNQVLKQVEEWQGRGG